MTDSRSTPAELISRCGRSPDFDACRQSSWRGTLLAASADDRGERQAASPIIARASGRSRLSCQRVSAFRATRTETVSGESEVRLVRGLQPVERVAHHPPRVAVLSVASKLKPTPAGKPLKFGPATLRHEISGEQPAGKTLASVSPSQCEDQHRGADATTLAKIWLTPLRWCPRVARSRRRFRLVVRWCDRSPTVLARRPLHGPSPRF